MSGLDGPSRAGRGVETCEGRGGVRRRGVPCGVAFRRASSPRPAPAARPGAGSPDLPGSVAPGGAAPSAPAPGSAASASRAGVRSCRRAGASGLPTRRRCRRRRARTRPSPAASAGSGRPRPRPGSSSCSARVRPFPDSRARPWCADPGGPWRNPPGRLPGRRACAGAPVRYGEPGPFRASPAGPCAPRPGWTEPVVRAGPQTAAAWHVTRLVTGLRTAGSGRHRRVVPPRDLLSSGSVRPAGRRHGAAGPVRRPGWRGGPPRGRKRAALDDRPGAGRARAGRCPSRGPAAPRCGVRSARPCVRPVAAIARVGARYVSAVRFVGLWRVPAVRAVPAGAIGAALVL